MKLILLYGPPAVGKLTVAKELSTLTKIPLFHSHMILNDLSRIFGYDNPARKKLEFEFKKRIMEEVILQEKSIITTGSVTRLNNSYYEELVDMFRKAGAELMLVQFIADRPTLMDRVKHESRSEKINNPQKLEEFLNNYPENLEKFGVGDQFVVDTTNATPENTASSIAKHYHLV